MADGDGEDEAAQAFEGLRAEVSLLRRAVERLAAERADDGHAPDYSETLGVIANNITATAQRVDALVKSPALSLTPEEMNRQIGAAGSAGRTEDRRVIAAARQTIEEIATKLGRQLESHVMADEQRRRLWRVGLAGIAIGMAVWAILAGPIVREFPPSWLLPERMAARTLRMPMWEGGQRLMKVGDPRRSPACWRAIGSRPPTATRWRRAASRPPGPGSRCAARSRSERGAGMDGDDQPARDALIALLDRTLRTEARADAPPEAERGYWLHGSPEPLTFTEPDRHGWMAIKPSMEPEVWMPRALVFWRMAVLTGPPVSEELRRDPRHSLARWPAIEAAVDRLSD